MATLLLINFYVTCNWRSGGVLRALRNFPYSSFLLLVHNACVRQSDATLRPLRVKFLGFDGLLTASSAPLTPGSHRITLPTVSISHSVISGVLAA
ncbi:hypothetical protein [Desulfotruncus arcticus]|uniref:hypothetical protein n=1 Tax=Desulfotruncus arcticus TaxID=341036 RepID=UPI001041E901|nr:hypothetical protein [Desulfotruncus arcticus]